MAQGPTAEHPVAGPRRPHPLTILTISPATAGRLHEHQRYQLHHALETQLGPDSAATLMAHLPPVGWADVATKHDLDVLRSNLDALEQRLDLRISTEFAGVRTEIAELGGTLRTELERSLRTSMIVTITAMTAIVSAIAGLTTLF